MNHHATLDEASSSGLEIVGENAPVSKRRLKPAGRNSRRSMGSPMPKPQDTRTKYFGTSERGNASFRGYIKCKMAHRTQGSNIIPDQVYLASDPLLWFQPLSFLANMIAQTAHAITCTLFVDIAGGHLLTVRFRADEHCLFLEDHSQIFMCEITGPENLRELATGTASISPEGRLSLTLYHHTRDATVPLILDSRHLRLSKWNIQGNRELENVGYAYFTSLPKIRSDEDLKEIAMASDGTLLFVRDNFEPPTPLPPDWRNLLINDILALDVYRESTKNRTATLTFSVDAASLAPQHLLKHSPRRGAVYYEICGPKIYRVGMSPDRTLAFYDKMVVSGADLKRFDYAIVGDARYIPGLFAPYNEENTAYMAKFHTNYDGLDMLTYWMTHTNQDHFSGFDPEMQRLAPPSL